MPYSSHGDTIRRLALLLGLCAMGCVQYVPTSADTIAPARELRILLTESAQAVLAPRIGVRVVALEAGRAVNEVGAAWWPNMSALVGASSMA